MVSPNRLPAQFVFLCFDGIRLHRNLCIGHGAEGQRSRQRKNPDPHQMAVLLKVFERSFTCRILCIGHGTEGLELCQRST